MFTPKGDARKPGEAECLAEGRQPGKYTRVREMPAGDEEVNYNSKTGLGTYCQALNTKTLTPTNPKETPKGPTIEEMLQEIEDQFANTNIQAPKLKQSYNLGTGLGENNPNVYKNQAVNFYVERTHRTLGRRPHDRPRRNRILSHPNDHPIRQR